MRRQSTSLLNLSFNPPTRKFEKMEPTDIDIHETPDAGDVDMMSREAPEDDVPVSESMETDSPSQLGHVTLRAIISSKEAGIVIGKAGKNVADLRDETGVKAGVSKVIPGVHDRVLTITGPLAGTARAYALVAKGLLEGAPQMGMGGIVSNNGTHRKTPRNNT
jgi:heterogeneous nuclear rnp K-like protein 2